MIVAVAGRSNVSSPKREFHDLTVSPTTPSGPRPSWQSCPAKPCPHWSFGLGRLSSGIGFVGDVLATRVADRRPGLPLVEPHGHGGEQKGNASRPARLGAQGRPGARSASAFEPTLHAADMIRVGVS